jgi:hypothetical protein
LYGYLRVVAVLGTTIAIMQDKAARLSEIGRF